MNVCQPFCNVQDLYDAVSKAIENVPYSLFHPSYFHWIFPSGWRLRRHCFRSRGAQFRASFVLYPQHPITQLCMGAPRALAIYTTHLLRKLSAVRELSIQKDAKKITFTYLLQLGLVFRGLAQRTDFFYRDLQLISILLYAKYWSSYLRRTIRSIESTRPNVTHATWAYGVISTIICIDVFSQILVWISDMMSLVDQVNKTHRNLG